MHDNGGGDEWLDRQHECAPARRVDASRGRHEYRVAFTNYDRDTDRQSVNYGAPIPPTEPGPVHAVRQWAHSGRRPGPPSRSFDLLHDKDAMCGRHVKLLSPQRFDPDDEDACPDCVERYSVDHYSG